MPPKKTRTSKSKPKEASPTHNSIGTQTEPTDISLQFQEQIENLKSDIEKNKLSYEQQLSIIRKENETLKKRLSVISNDEKLNIKDEKVQNIGSIKKVMKGCSCKGNCSSKICGCVKKGMLCHESCSCNLVVCKNQDHEKENTCAKQSILTQDDEKTLVKLGRLTLNQEVRHASEKKSKRSIFSPFGNRDEVKTNDQIPYSPIRIETRRRLLFNNNANELVDVGDADAEAAQIEPIKSENVVDSSGQQESSSQYDDKAITKRTRKIKNTEKKSETNCDSYQMHEIKRKEIKKKSNNECLKVPSIIISYDDQASSDQGINSSISGGKVVHSPRKMSPSNCKVNLFEEKQDDCQQIHGKIIHSPRSSRNKSPSEENHDDYPNNRGKVVHSPLLPRKQNTSLSECTDEKPDGCEKGTSCSVPSYEFINHRKIPKVSKTRRISTEISDESKVGLILDGDQNISLANDIAYKSDEIAAPASLVKHSLSMGSDSSGNGSSSSQSNLDVSLNPMVPKKQLPRSPVQAEGSIIMTSQSKRFSPPQKELAVAEVNWEQHQSQLIGCNICKRKFFPHRIDKHIKSCLGT